MAGSACVARRSQVALHAAWVVGLICTLFGGRRAHRVALLASCQPRSAPPPPPTRPHPVGLGW